MLTHLQRQQYQRFMGLLIVTLLLFGVFVVLGVNVIPNELLGIETFSASQANQPALKSEASMSLQILHHVVFLILMFVMALLGYEWVAIALPELTPFQTRYLNLLLMGIAFSGVMAVYQSRLVLLNPLTLGQQYHYGMQLDLWLVHQSLFAAMLVISGGVLGMRKGFVPANLYRLSVVAGVLELAFALIGLQPFQPAFIRLAPIILQGSTLTIWGAYLYLRLQTDCLYNTDTELHAN